MYKYGYLNERGYGAGCQPSGFVKVAETEDGSKYHGYVWYEIQLRDIELQTYELELIKDGLSLEERIRNCVDEMADGEIVDVWNRYCDSNNYIDDRIEYMEFLNDFYCGCTPFEVLEKANNNSFDTTDIWFKEDGFGLQSTDYCRDWIEVDDLVDYLVENEEHFDNSDLKNVLEDYWLEELEEDDDE